MTDIDPGATEDQVYLQLEYLRIDVGATMHTLRFDQAGGVQLGTRGISR
jgi:hypothetical protein